MSTDCLCRCSYWCCCCHSCCILCTRHELLRGKVYPKPTMAITLSLHQPSILPPCVALLFETNDRLVDIVYFLIQPPSLRVSSRFSRNQSSLRRCRATISDSTTNHRYVLRDAFFEANHRYVYLALFRIQPSHIATSYVALFPTTASWISHFS